MTEISTTTVIINDAYCLLIYVSEKNKQGVEGKTLIARKEASTSGNRYTKRNLRCWLSRHDKTQAREMSVW